jgi:hypothetical protein
MNTVDQLLLTLQNAQTNQTSEASTALTQQLVATIYQDPKAAAELLHRLLDAESPRYAYGDLVDYVAEEDLPAFFERCLPAAGLDHKEAEQRNVYLAMDTAQRLAWQRPDLFREVLPLLWTREWSSVRQAWHGADRQEVARLAKELEHGDDIHKRWHSEGCLSEVPLVEAYEALRQAGPEQPTVPVVIDDRWDTAPNTEGVYFIADASVEYRDGRWTRLHPEACYHLRFPVEVLEAQEMMRHAHPTWHLPGSAGQARFGGMGEAGCTVCGKESHHLLTLDQPVPGIPVSGRVVFETCLHCMISERPMYAYHDDYGRPHIQPSYMVHERDYDPPPLPECTVHFAPTPARWYWQPDDSDQNCCRLGGPPIWKQSPDFPYCESCNLPMLLLVHLGGWTMLMIGVIQVFWCDACRVSAVLNTYS